MTHVLAIDPGMKCGFAHSAGIHGVWQVGGSPHAGGPAACLIDSILALAAEYPFERIITEGGFTGNFKGKPALEALRAAVQIAAYRLGCLPVRVVAPSTLKLYAAGHGHAEKPAMMRACIDLCGVVPQDDNHADALLMLHLARVNKPVERTTTAKPRKSKSAAVAKPAETVGKSGRKIITGGNFPF